MDFADANTVVHPVTTQWHYPILTKAGFVPETKEAAGFVRSYLYVHPDGRKIRAATGFNADYWDDLTSGGYGYWGTLGTHVTK